MNAFDTLGLEPGFETTAEAIEAAYLRRVAAARSRGEDTSPLNQARQTLLKPILRAEALVEVLGGPAPAADKSLPEGLLMEFMEARQGAEAAAEAGDQPELVRWLDWARSKRAAHIETVATLFGEASPEALRLIRLELNAWRYAERMIDQLEDDGSGGA